MLASLVAVLICAIAGTAVAADPFALERDDSAVEHDDRRGVPVREPLRAWAAAAAAVQPGGTVRRIAFARHGVFVFHSPPRSWRIMATFIAWDGSGYRAEATEARDDMQCTAAGVDPVRVGAALARLLHGELWRRHAAQLDSLILECSGSSVGWLLLPEPAGGFKAGVAIPTYEARFDP